jgi:hypothetical protein
MACERPRLFKNLINNGVAKREKSIEKTPAMMISLTDRPPDYWCWLNSR